MKNVRLYAFLGVILLSGLCILAAGLYYFNVRARAFNSRPLLLIHAPINHDLVGVGDGVLVHATAREDNGLRRIEFWADDQLIEARDASSQSVTNLTLSSHWIPEQAGAHVLIARAISADGVEGQSTVIVQVTASGEEEPQTHTFQEGETAESIAADHDVSLDDLSASNPDIGSAAPGDELIIPDDDPPAAQEGESPDAGEAPSAVGDAPGSEPPWFGDIGMFETFFPPGEPVLLRLEVLELRTSQDFDSLHCYVGFADSSPLWFPDADNDQTTDESFALLSGGEWDVTPYLAGDAAPVISWPENRPLPLNVSCVGIAGGGTEALELGRVELSIPPEYWGSPRSVETDGEGGHLFLQYRITLPLHDVPKDIDHSMTPPTNVRLDHSRNVLLWDYNPDLTRNPPEEPINRFDIYLNGNLQWEVEPDARETRLPDEWFHPRCGDTYRFEVKAKRSTLNEETNRFEGYESVSGVAEVTTPLEGCTYEIQVILESLETFDLGGDGDPGGNKIDGDVGPPYGHFFANEGRVHFETFFPDWNQGYIGPLRGLFNNHLYDLNSLSLQGKWGFDSRPVMFVDVPHGGTFELGFEIMDNDRREDDLICRATTGPQGERVFSAWQDGVLRSDDGRCLLNYSFGPTAGSPVGYGDSRQPYPQMEVETITVDIHTGRIRLLVRNSGRATWTSGLVMVLTTRDGQAIQLLRADPFTLRPRYERILDFTISTAPQYRSEDVCVILDPNFDYQRFGIPELNDEHQPVCVVLPDLTISDAILLQGSGVLRIRTQNVGEGRVWGRKIGFYVVGPGGATLITELLNENLVTMEPGESHTFRFTLNADVLAQLQRGFYVVVNRSSPDSRVSFAESNEFNNSYHVEP